MNEPDEARPRDRVPEQEAIDDAARDWLLVLSSAEATEHDRARFQQWLDADARHREAFETLRGLWHGIDDLEDAFAGARRVASEQPAPTTDPAAPPAASAARTGPVASRPRRRAAWSAAAAACLVLALGAATDWWTALVADHRTGVGDQARITLPDGSVAWLNTDTAIDVEYGGDQRRVTLLHGEARFEVSPDAGRPFAVHAQEGRSAALGTAYTVHDQGDGATVTVSEGTVEVRSPAGQGGEDPRPAGARRIVNAGEQVRYATGAPPGPVRAADLQAETAWRRGFVAIDGMPLADALAEIDRYRPGRIVLLDATAADEPVTARLSIDSIDHGLEALAATQDLAVTRVTGYLVLVH